MTADEENLIQLAQRGDTASFGALYHRYLPQIYRFVLFKVNQRQAAEDITHDVFMNAWQGLNRYVPQGFPFSSWLYQIARNRIIDHYRTRKPQTSLENVDENIFETHSFNDLKFDDQLNWQQIQSALVKLSPDQQDVILMRFVEDLSHQEIASALDKSEGAIRLLQHRAINKLKGLLNNQDVN